MKKSEWKKLYQDARWDRRAMPENLSRQRDVEGTIIVSHSDMVLIYPCVVGPRKIAACRDLAFANFGIGFSKDGRKANLQFQNAWRIKADMYGFKLP